MGILNDPQWLSLLQALGTLVGIIASVIGVVVKIKQSSDTSSPEGKPSNRRPVRGGVIIGISMALLCIVLASVAWSMLSARSIWITDSNCVVATDGSLHAFGGNNRTGHECLSQHDPIANGIISVDITQISGSTRSDGPEYGIIFRRTNTSTYHFGISPAGAWNVWLVANSVFSPIITYKFSYALNQGLGVTNTLEVKTEGENLSFYINAVEVGQATGQAVSSGSLGIYASGNTESVFRNFNVQTA